ncbi:hypothetical protein NQ314_014324 [Rhamnusium bicolor]|uniref:Peptidase S1 domain-containing protein n=1 Tax=Rhamnusium bicolor TaxID=1586634 RepID=A0AAV8X3J1_9CUCU|nr:hypothetical protein NQ314_014324 [Rhamnusium bicolor]
MNNHLRNDYDIALVKLSSSVSNTIAKSIALPSRGTRLSVGDVATITAWGSFKEDGNRSTVLQKVQVPIVSQADCQDAYFMYKITPRILCTGFLGDGGHDACRGDSGGAVIVNGVLHGIVSWGRGCGRPDFPGVHTNVAYFRQWISVTTKK